MFAAIPKQPFSELSGQSDESLTSLAKSEEFAYVRTLMAWKMLRTKTDSVYCLIHLFVVSLWTKLTELRRLKCFNNLRMIGHAAAMYETKWPSAKSLKELEQANCLPDGFQ